MTLKEKVAEMQLDCIDDIYEADGVKRCPSDYDYLNKPELYFNSCECERYFNCCECWNQTFVDKSVDTVDKSDNTEQVNRLTRGTADVTRNLAKVSDTFICEKCGIWLEDCVKVEYDEDTEDTAYQEYEFKFCPRCGRKVEE